MVDRFGSSRPYGMLGKGGWGDVHTPNYGIISQLGDESVFFLKASTCGWVGSVTFAGIYTLVATMETAI